LEYSYLTLNGGDVGSLECKYCQFNGFTIEGKIKYGFFFLEYLPFVPLKKTLTLHCKQCKKTHSNKSIDPNLYKEIQKKVFKFRCILPLYTGLILTLLGLGYWQYLTFQENALIQTYIHSPQKDDYYFINYKKINENSRPNQKYRLGKVVSINNGLVTMIYGGFTYTRVASLINDVQGGMTYDSRYFMKGEHHFTISELEQYYDDSAVLFVKRPVNNRLYGHVVIGSISTNKKYKLLAEMYNDKGLAFMKHSNIKENLANANKYFLKSAEGGYSKGQVNLSKLLIGIGKIDEALYWLNIAALQGNPVATKLYMDNCKSINNCNKTKFILELKNKGFNVSS
jgi:hypothetical protein